MFFKFFFLSILRKSIAEEIEPKTNSVITEEQVADHMQRLNLYFKNENVSDFDMMLFVFLSIQTIHLLIQRKIDPDDIKSRQVYLRAQRDKIVALKRKVRTEQFTTKADIANRPKSSRAAQRVLFSTPEISDDTKHGSLQVRRALAERLRNEVVDANE